MDKTKILKILYVNLIILLIIGISFLNLLGYIGNEYSYERRFDLNMDQATTMTQAPGDSSVVYIAEKAGRVLKVDNIAGEDEYDVFLDLSDRVVVTNEDGLIGIAFHPDYPEVNKFYTFHSEVINASNLTFETIISAFNVTNGVADKNSQVVLIRNFQDDLYHRGGNLRFGPDGYLYIHIGDGSEQERAQNTTNFYGSILRIDVDNPINSTIPYGIPADNPFVTNPNILDEIYAYGMRNPFRGDFDSTTGNYYFGDVGNARREEVNILEAGGNYEWPFYEGNLCRECTNDTRWNAPLLDYPHPETGSEELGVQFEFQNLDDPYGIAIIGTTIYRGSTFGDLQGQLIMTDYLGLVFSVNLDDGSTQFLTRFPNIIAHVWQDVSTNELYFVGLGIPTAKSGVYMLVESIPVYWYSGIVVISLLILIPLILKLKARTAMSM